MLWCPKCGAVYDDSFSECPDCVCPVVPESELPEGFFSGVEDTGIQAQAEAADESGDFSFLARAVTQQQYVLYSSQLTGFGIPFCLRRPEKTGIEILNLLRGYPAEGYEILVPESGLEDARILLKLERPDTASDDDGS